MVRAQRSEAWELQRIDRQAVGGRVRAYIPGQRTLRTPYCTVEVRVSARRGSDRRRDL